jgi:hypothetical protein
MGFFRKIWVKILIGVILVLAVGSTAAYLSRTRKNQPISQLHLPSPAPTVIQPTSAYFIQPSPIARLGRLGESDATATWVTYVDLTKTFIIQHPPKFYETKEVPFPSAGATVKGWQDAGILSTESNTWGMSNPDDMVIQMSIVAKKPNEPLETSIDNAINENSGEFAPGHVIPDVKRKIIVDGRDGLWYEGSLGPAVPHIDVFIPKDENTMVIFAVYTGQPQLGPDKLYSAHKALLEQMLSTLQFLK